MTDTPSWLSWHNEGVHMSGYGDVDGVRAEQQGDVLRITLTNPTNRNAQTPTTWRRLASLAELVTPATRAVVLSAEGPSFCAGLDRRMLTPDGVPGERSILDLATLDRGGVDAFIVDAQAGFRWLRETPAITIALVNGHAIGAGFQLALACDWMIVGDDAQLAMRETSLGMVPDLGGTLPLLDRVGYSRAFEICATGRFVGAEEAVRLGIAVAQVPQDQWDAYVDTALTPIRAALPDAVGELKALLQDPDARDEQYTRERAAQMRRLAALQALMAGSS